MDISIILITTAVITVIGLVVGAGLVFTGKKFAVEVDEREAAVRELLPGNNCGACGFAGCDAMAAAIAAGEAPVNGCPVGGSSTAKKIGVIMGVEAGAVIRKIAFVRCKGSCEYTQNQGLYIGIMDCASAVRAGLALTDCDYGCVGLGSCVKVCPQGAITVRNGVAVVNRRKCVGCGLCAKACPKNLIELIPETHSVAVQCSNRDKGPQVKKVCSAGCIGCMLCTRHCKTGAVTVENNLARINYEACTQCGKCAEMCPSQVITRPAGKQPAEAHIGPAKEPQPVGADAHIGPAKESQPVGADARIGPAKEPQPVGADAHIGPAKEPQPVGADARIGPAKEPQPVGADAHIGPSQEKKES